MLKQFQNHHQGAAASLAKAGPLLRANLLSLIADRLECNSANLMVAGGQDLQAGRRAGLTEEELALLKVDAGSIRNTCAGLRNAAEKISRQTEENGQSSGPEGVVLLLGHAGILQFAEAAGLCLASGRVCLLAGNASAAHGNAFIGGVIRGALLDLDLPEHALLWLEQLDKLEDADFNEINAQMGLALWLGGPEPEGSLADQITIPFVRVAEAALLPQVLAQPARGGQEA